jgi:predicted TIM-barrel fold metal-dependent hydrolase
MSTDLFTVALEEHFGMPALMARNHHVVGPEPFPPGSEKYAQLVELGERRIAAMDAAGVDIQVISHTAPALEHVLDGDGPALAREANDLLLDLIGRRPTRFAGFAALPVSDPGAAADELRRTVGLGLVGALVNGAVDGRFLDDPSFDDLLTVAEDLGVPIYVHPGIPPAAVKEAYYSGFSPAVSNIFATAAWGWHAETAVHVLRLVLAGVFDRHPRLQIIIGHMGEMLPVMIDRANSVLSPVSGLERPVRDYLTDHVHLTIAGVFSPPAFQAAVQTWGIGRLMFSTDYPFVPGAPAKAFLRNIPLAPEDRLRFAGLNAAALLKLGVPDSR